jgi:hypothetical protein
MKTYSLTSAAYPRRLPQGEAEIVYKCLEPYETIHTMEELIVEAKARKLDALFKRPDATTIPECLKYHLKRFANEGWVRIAESE